MRRLSAFVSLSICTALLPSRLAAQASPAAFRELAKASLAKIDGTQRLSGLRAEVQVIRDRWGVPHIYAQNMDDLFFAQGYVQAQDRLWQMEMWRRIGDGTVAEVVGPSAIARDKLARLLMYRGPYDDSEFASYAPEGKRILDAFARGVNAFIQQNKDNLPVEFKLTGIKPQLWTARTPLLRRTTMQAATELRLAQEVARLGIDEVNRRDNTEPHRTLTIPKGLNLAAISDAVVEAGGGGARNARAAAAELRGGGLPKPPLLPEYAGWQDASTSLNLGAIEDSPGSNNWVIRGSKSATGKVLLAGDPHRQVTNPSLRYLVHLSAPGWNVVGATEPVLPGVLFGHNEYIGWALTIVGTDQADVFVNEVNPANRNQIKWKGQWEDLKVVHDTIRVKGQRPEIVELKFSRHGPIFYEDTVNHLNYAYRSVNNEPGSAGYLSGLALDQTKSCKDFLDEVLKRFKTPTENMVCGDVDGNISWMAAALSPKRAGGWDGRLPVPGTGDYEWAGFRTDLPREYNPERGFIATANNMLQPLDDPNWTPLYFRPPGYPRYERIYAKLAAGTHFTVDDFERLQHDTYWAEAEQQQEYLKGWTGKTPELEQARALVADWDRYYTRPSVAASVYNFWNRRLVAHRVVSSMPRAVRDSLSQVALQEALADLTSQYHRPWNEVNWGHINRSEFPHPLVSAYDLPAIERRGGAGVVAAIGATIHQITDFSNFDNSVQMNVPGQSAQPGSPYYGDLSASFADGVYFQQAWTRPAVEKVAAHRLVLAPAK